MADETKKNDGGAPQSTQAGEVVIEIATRKCQTVYMPPFATYGIEPQELRGRWERHKVMGGLVQELQAMPDIPGLCLALDVQRKRLRIFDPLGLKENEDLLERVSAVHKSAVKIENGGRPIKPVKSTTRENLTDEMVATIHYWMQRLVDEKQAILRSGNFSKNITGRVRVTCQQLAGEPVFKDQVDKRMEAAMA